MAQMAWKLDHAAGEHRSDHELVQASRHDAAAFDVLYRRYVAQVFWYLRSRTASREDAADLTQQVFLRCYESLAHYEDRGLPFTCWLFRVARNLAIDAARRQRHRTFWIEAHGEDVVPPQRSVEVVTTEREAMQHLTWLIAQLDDDKRELLALRFGAGLRLTEIAALRGRSEAATRKQLQRLIKALKEQYEDD